MRSEIRLIKRVSVGSSGGAAQKLSDHEIQINANENFGSLHIREARRFKEDVREPAGT